MGLGFVDLTVLMEEMGRAVMPGPVLLHGAAGRPADPRGRLGRAEEGVAAEGSPPARPVALAWTEPSAAGTPRRRGTARAEPAAASSLSGTKLFVLDAHLADVLVVVARTREGRGPRTA